MNTQDFYNGTVFDAYEYFGAHLVQDGAVFRTWAPSAERVTVIGDFNGWQEWDLTARERAGFYEIFVPGAKAGQMYKYVIYGRNGRVEHCDPYGFGMELRPGSASVIRDMHAFHFTDDAWMRSRTRCLDRPLNIYECHLGSFRTNPDNENGWYSYEEIAEPLIEYVRKYHFTHVEFMPLAEYPFDGSWGYQTTGYFAPTSRYGTADQLKTLVDRLHAAGIGVILDIVPAHFALDSYGLRMYDGTPLYEYPSSDVSESEWGSCNFIFSRREVCCFMQSAANYWLTEYHFDGLRMDAVSRLIYWMGDEARGVNGNAVDFLREMNSGLHRLHPTAMLIAEDSTAFPGCTHPASEGGLDFDYKWDLGWMNDTLDYMKKQSFERSSVPEKLTFSMMYFYNEHYLLPFSHDETVHGKKTIIDKIFGEYEEKFAQVKSLYLYMTAHPGKTLNFMGNEIAMFREWDETREPDYFLLNYPTHDSFSRFFADLMKIAAEEPALYERDYESWAFSWITMNDGGHNVFGILRRSGLDSVAAFFNFSGSLEVYHYTPLEDQILEIMLDTNAAEYGGSGPSLRSAAAAAAEAADGDGSAGAAEAADGEGSAAAGEAAEPSGQDSAGIHGAGQLWAAAGYGVDVVLPAFSSVLFRIRKEADLDAEENL